MQWTIVVEWNAKMNDLISRQEFMKAMYHRAFETDDDTMWQSGCWVRYRAIEQVVKEQPSADAVQVVRCKECRWYKTNYMWNGTEVKICAKEAYEPRRNADDFCSHGERDG